jgi:hypothetical protein
MKHYCCTSDPKLFNANVLSVSDEAFLLLVLINGGARWMSEIKRENGKVVLTDKEAMQLFTYTFYNAHRIMELGKKTRNLQCL